MADGLFDILNRLGGAVAAGGGIRAGVDPAQTLFGGFARQN